MTTLRCGVNKCFVHGKQAAGDWLLYLKGFICPLAARNNNEVAFVRCKLRF